MYPQIIALTEICSIFLNNCSNPTTSNQALQVLVMSSGFVNLEIKTPLLVSSAVPRWLKQHYVVRLKIIRNLTCTYVFQFDAQNIQIWALRLTEVLKFWGIWVMKLCGPHFVQQAVKAKQLFSCYSEPYERVGCTLYQIPTPELSFLNM